MYTHSNASFGRSPYTRRQSFGSAYQDNQLVLARPDAMMDTVPGDFLYNQPRRYSSGGHYDQYPVAYDDYYDRHDSMTHASDYNTVDNYALTPYSRRNPSFPSLHRTPSYGARIAEHIRPSYSTTGYGRQSYGTRSIKFKRKGAFRSGILLGEAQANVRLSNNDRYTFFDLGADDRGNIAMQIRWPGHTSITYEIPLDGYDGRVDLQTLGRRVARSCAHYLQANLIPISWDRVELQQLNEIGFGLWEPILLTP